MKKIISLTVIFFIFIWSEILQADVYIKITKGVDIARPIGIFLLQWESSGMPPENFVEIVTADLRNSGKFDPLNASSLPQQLDNLEKIQPSYWKKLGIDTVVIGKLILNVDGSYQVSYQLIDTSNSLNNVLAQNSFKVTKQWLRYAIHNVSNEIFEKLIGIKGAFCTRIAYVVKNSNKDQIPYELRIADYDGYNQFVVYHSMQPIMSPAWSSDGTKLAYVTFESGKSALVIQTLANGNIRQIASYPCHNGAPSFSPDGSKLAFVLSKTGSLNLYVMDINSEQIIQITDDRFNNTEPTWFPDNQTLAYTSDQSGSPQIYKINIHGGMPKRISWNGSRNQNADISFDGKMLIMITNVNGIQHVAKQDMETGVVQILTSTFLDETPSIAPNGTMIIYSSIEGMGSILQLVSSNGHFKASLPASNGQVKFPAWSPYL
ncbi:Tol-Pal system beta propeller repeat protein TolB [Pantoea sp. Aalb]|uniref:Tol-Pal system beta propeller repeat protein TolB n=1 Tax=Pantoea sp. Aalb TaxID=2576762 RepID=UPI0013297692|nr:Tol-Pal system beta propeller repeat protein TolB [Pantoea sp. Aalb]MXP67527.1 Tol-Pal system protein TolB [Pantoea sp. Aalb]